MIDLMPEHFFYDGEENGCTKIIIESGPDQYLLLVRNIEGLSPGLLAQHHGERVREHIEKIRRGEAIKLTQKVPSTEYFVLEAGECPK